MSRRCWHVAGCVLVILALGGPPAFGASSNLKTVCASGCGSSDLQATIDSITDSSASNPYTILIDAGVLESDASFTTNGKSHITFQGTGIGGSVLRASADWFDNVDALTESPDFLDLSDSTDVTVRGLTIDVQKNLPATFSEVISAVRVDDADNILVESAEILGVTYGLWEDLNSAGNVIKVFNSQIRGINNGVRAQAATWLIFSSDIRAVSDGTTPSATALLIVQAKQVVVWGSHLHGEGTSSDVDTVRAVHNLGASSFIGSTLHVKFTGSLGSNQRVVALEESPSSTSTTTLVGTDLLYETLQEPTPPTVGTVGGIATGANFSKKIILSGCGIFDVGGNGGQYRADVIAAPGLAPFSGPTIQNTGSKISSLANTTGNTLRAGLGSAIDTLSLQKGAVTFQTSATAAVTLPAPLPDTSYRVALSGNANEGFWVTGKTASGFTVNSSKPNSTATVDWVLMR